jgi:NDP-sugar pyrophosphorylase family protein
MAGRNTRFHDVGIDIPKYLLPFLDRPVIEQILGNLNEKKSFSNVYLIAHQRDIFFKDELQNSLRLLEINPDNLFYIGETKGQADTANEALNLLGLDPYEPIVFHNADTILLNRKIESLESTFNLGRGIIDVFAAESPSYSYVNIQKNRILKIVEKRVISNWATSGLYGFPSGAVFQNYFKKFSDSQNPLKEDENYISDIINLMLEERIEFEPLSQDLKGKSNTLVIGSPEEYRDLQPSTSFPKYVS